ncbi:hypothetical protein [Streptomyces sp. DH37]|uniref:hypothetical protein n=1 Tax=Streptomyces sp. DH37 TaxID=3040122 RepID=UPI00244322B8|nr:hypothetical protein [Streptomyces sp. DH37]MDG9705278.1 hypothetical protein [Streptomyces sp. DH37]
MKNAPSTHWPGTGSCGSWAPAAATSTSIPPIVRTRRRWKTSPLISLSVRSAATTHPANSACAVGAHSRPASSGRNSPAGMR